MERRFVIKEGYDDGLTVGQSITESELKSRIKIIRLCDGLSDDEAVDILIHGEVDEGIDRPQDIAEQTGWDVSKVNNVKRRLFRNAAKLKDLIRKGEK